MSDWMNCTIRKEGNVFSWRNSSKHIKLTGLKKDDESLDNICPGSDKTSHLHVGKDTLNFEDTLNYCNKIGSMAVISSKEAAHEVNKTLASYGLESQDVFTGYTDIEVEGEWVVHGTQQQMTWHDWYPREPNNAGGEHCAAMSRPGLKFWDTICNQLLIPVCILAEVNVRLLT